jgi:hypothetical protein
MLRPDLLRDTRTHFETGQTAAYFAGHGLDCRPRTIDAHYVRELIQRRTQILYGQATATGVPSAEAGITTE